MNSVSHKIYQILYLQAGTNERPNKVEQVHLLANLVVQIFRELDHENG